MASNGTAKPCSFSCSCSIPYPFTWHDTKATPLSPTSKRFDMRRGMTRHGIKRHSKAMLILMLMLTSIPVHMALLSVPCPCSQFPIPSYQVAISMPLVPPVQGALSFKSPTVQGASPFSPRGRVGGVGGYCPGTDKRRNLKNRIVNQATDIQNR